MANPQQKQKRRIDKRDIIFGIIGAVIILFAGWLVYERYKPAPTYPLGDSNKLEYVGEVGYGCWWACDSDPSAVYYYATDMSMEEVIEYFREARKKADAQTSSTGVNNKTVIYQQQSFVDNSGNIFYLDYYEQGGDVINNYKLASTKKQHLISIDSQLYPLAEKSL